MAIELHPLEQFQIQRADPAPYRRRRPLLHQLGAADDDRGRRGHRADRARHAQSGAGPRPIAVGRRDELRVRRRHGGHQCRAAARPYFPFVFTLFMFILFANLLGLVPYSFTVTSHIIVTFALALVVFIGVTIIGIVRHGVHFLRLFVPPGCRRCCWWCWCRSRSCPISSGRSRCRSGCSPTCWRATRCWRSSPGLRRRRRLRDLAGRHQRRALRPRAAGRGAAGLCLRDPDLSLPARRAASALIAAVEPVFSPT